MNLDNLKFRQLENGYTIKYHVTLPPRLEQEPPRTGFGGELYVKDLAELKAAVIMLIDKHDETKPIEAKP